LPLSQFYGLARSFPWQARFTFLSFLGRSGFPISPVFLGEDLLLSSVIHAHPGLVVVFALVFMLNGAVNQKFACCLDQEPWVGRRKFRHEIDFSRTTQVRLAGPTGG
jgi:hypothetical protein